MKVLGQHMHDLSAEQITIYQKVNNQPQIVDRTLTISGRIRSIYALHCEHGLYAHLSVPGDPESTSRLGSEIHGARLRCVHCRLDSLRSLRNSLRLQLASRMAVRWQPEVPRRISVCKPRRRHEHHSRDHSCYSSVGCLECAHLGHKKTFRFTGVFSTSAVSHSPLKC
jgi:hypothetical protein